MSEPTTPLTTPPLFNLAPGLIEYYSSQAELMLAQYENINRLLGPTQHGTPTGDFCEILLRDFLRKFLPPSLSADKGFFYGRATLEGEDTHCPEIDILIHETQRQRPLFRLGDFVIVQPHAVRGMIQVKRTLSDSQFRRGVKNVVMAKQHLLNVLWDERGRVWGTKSLPPNIFTAVVGFGDEMGDGSVVYRNLLLKWSKKYRQYDRQDMVYTNMHVLPTFIGSLSKKYLYLHGRGDYCNHQYHMVNARHGKVNICIQSFLAKIYDMLGGEWHEMPPFAFPENVNIVDDFYVLEIVKAVYKPKDGTVTLHRNDGYKIIHRKVDDLPVEHYHHLVFDGSSQLTITDELKKDFQPQMLYVKRGGCVEHYKPEKYVPPAQPAK